MGFLRNKGLVVLAEDGAFELGPRTTFLSRDDRLVNQHNRNWRLKSIDQLAVAGGEDLYFTAPMVISDKTFTILRSRLFDLIKGLQEEVEKSPSERLTYLGLDFIKLT